MKGGDKWRWISRICLITSAIAGWFVGYFHPIPVLDMHSINTDPQIAQALLFGGSCTIITLFAWFWPGTGGVVAFMFAGYEALLGRVAAYQTPHMLYQFYVLIFIILLFGGLISVVYRVRSVRPEMHQNRFAEKGIKIARYGAIASVILCIMTYSFGGAEGIYFLLAGFLGFIFIGMAWKWPSSGGLLMVLAVFSVFPLAASGFGLGTTLPAYILLTVFVASGLLNVLGAWKQGLLRYG